MGIVYRYVFDKVWSEDVWNEYAPFANNLTLKASAKYFVDSVAITKYPTGTTYVSQLQSVSLGSLDKIKIIVNL